MWFLADVIGSCVGSYRDARLSVRKNPFLEGIPKTGGRSSRPDLELKKRARSTVVTGGARNETWPLIRPTWWLLV